MPQKFDQEQESDLDRTDQLPVLNVVALEDTIVDDAVPLEYPATESNNKATFPRPAHLDLPMLAETVRTIEERIARQTADYQALTHAYERSQNAEAAAVSRANALSEELTELRKKLEADQARIDELGRTIAEKDTAVERARARTEDAASQAARSQEETQSLRETIATRDATIAQVLQSLGEREAQLTALHRDHAAIVPALDAQSRTSKQLEADLQSARENIESLRTELKERTAETANLSADVRRFQSELDSTRYELNQVKTQSASYLEQLRSRDWRNGFNQNLFREMDAAVGAVQADAGALKSERDALTLKIEDLSRQLAEREETIGKLQEKFADHAQEFNRFAAEQQQNRQAQAELTAKIEALEAEKLHQAEQLAQQTAESARARAESDEAMQRINAQLQSTERRNEEQVAEIRSLRAESESTQQEMNVLMAHLKEARRPIEVIEAEVRSAKEELAQKIARLTEIETENRELKAQLERSRGALEEREFLIRRLERSESMNASALGRIQTTIERLATTPGATLTQEPAAATPAAAVAASLERLDGSEVVTYSLGRRTRIGRATDCDLRIDSNSVSRHHAVILLSPRGAIIEDMNSTNGVIVNGSKVSRQFLNDGDDLAIGEIKLRFRTNQISA